MRPLVLLAILLLPSYMECRPQSAVMLLPVDTTVLLRLTKNLYKKDAKPGQPLEFEVGYDVVVNGRIFIQSGTAVKGSSVLRVDDADKSQVKLLINLGHAQTVSGEDVPLITAETAASNAVFDIGAGGVLIPAFAVMRVFEKKVLLDKDGGFGTGVWVAARVAETVAVDPERQSAAQAQYIARQNAIEATVHFEKATVLREQGDFADAVSEYRIAVQLKPQTEGYRTGFIESLEESGDLDAALAETKETIQTWPDRPYFHYLLGHLLIKKNVPDAAIVELQWALKEKNNHLPEANCELGRAFELKGDTATALRQYRAGRSYDNGCHAAYERLQVQVKR